MAKSYTGIVIIVAIIAIAYLAIAGPGAIGAIGAKDGADYVEVSDTVGYGEPLEIYFTTGNSLDDIEDGQLILSSENKIMHVSVVNLYGMRIAIDGIEVFPLQEGVVSGNSHSVAYPPQQIQYEGSCTPEFGYKSYPENFNAIFINPPEFPCSYVKYTPTSETNPSLIEKAQFVKINETVLKLTIPQYLAEGSHKVSILWKGDNVWGGGIDQGAIDFGYPFAFWNPSTRNPRGAIYWELQSLTRRNTYYMEEIFTVSSAQKDINCQVYNSNTGQFIQGTVEGNLCLISAEQCLPGQYAQGNFCIFATSNSDQAQADLQEIINPDAVESPSDPLRDANNNGIPDIFEGDSNNNGIPDYQELDTNQNGVPDYTEFDNNGNGIPDYLEDGEGVPSEPTQEDYLLYAALIALVAGAYVYSRRRKK